MQARSFWLWGAVGAILFMPLLSIGAEPEVSTILDKALAARGGAKAPVLKAATWKEEGTYYGMGDAGLPYTATCAMQMPDKLRMEVSGVFTMVVDGDKGWQSAGDARAELSKEQLAAQQNLLYSVKVTAIHVLKMDKGFKIEKIDDLKVNDRPAYGLKVTLDKHPDIKLYFDKETFLVVQNEMRTYSAEQSKEVEQQELYSDYKDVDGRKQAGTITILHDGKKYVEFKITDFKPVDKLPEGTFTKD
ncbi:MAG TPA: hypothetical protein VFE24_16660 [Pirellulales bacterium]|jgi:hypothetical protein|nr:hypothetical protein [Pirellulales bacterium]